MEQEREDYAEAEQRPRWAPPPIALALMIAGALVICGQVVASLLGIR
jgi:hypothetical protein